MGFKKTLLGKFLRGAAKSSIVRKTLRAIPIVGTAVGIAEIAGEVGSMLPKPSRGSGAGGLPALPGFSGGSMQLPAPIRPQSTGGLTSMIPSFRGPGGRMQLPSSDPKVPSALKSVTLDDSYLKTYYRAPKGYVVVRDPQGRPFPMLKSVARSYGLWKPSKKPPISVTDWQAFKRSERVMKKLDRIAKSNLHMQKKRRVSSCR